MAEFLVRFVFEIVLLGLRELLARLGRFVARPMLGLSLLVVALIIALIALRWR